MPPAKTDNVSYLFSAFLLWACQWDLEMPRTTAVQHGHSSVQKWTENYNFCGIKQTGNNHEDCHSFHPDIAAVILQNLPLYTGGHFTANGQTDPCTALYREGSMLIWTSMTDVHFHNNLQNHLLYFFSILAWNCMFLKVFFHANQAGL